VRDFQRGLLATLPLAPGVVAFGFLYGMMGGEVGFSTWSAWAMSLIVHAGSAQFTALGMWKAASAVPIILTTLRQAQGRLLVINLRHMLIGASVAPYLMTLGATMRKLSARRSRLMVWHQTTGAARRRAPG